MGNARIAWAFLTRLPGGRHPAGGDELTGSVPWFGVVGIVVGALGAAVFWSAQELGAGPTPAAVAAVTVTALVTGGFHEDGLADSVDALAAGSTVDDRLRILKDSRHGTFGVLALVLATAWKVAALGSLDAFDGAIALIVAHSLGRSAAVAVMGVFPSARSDGLGADAGRDLAVVPAVIGTGVGAAVAVAAYGLSAVVVIAVALSAAGGIGWWAVRRIRGITGDILGAAEQVAEVVVMAAAIWLSGTSFG